MTKHSSSPHDPFAQYLKAYSALTSRIKDAGSLEEMATLTKEINAILQDHFKAIMSYFNSQYQQIIDNVDENKKHVEQLTKKSILKGQDFIEQSVLQAQQLMQQNLKQFEKAFLPASSPQDLFTQSLHEMQSALSLQTEHWQTFYAKQKEDALKEMEPFQSQMKQMLENTEKLRQETIENFKKVETTMKKFLQQKQSELEGKIKPTGKH